MADTTLTASWPDAHNAAVAALFEHLAVVRRMIEGIEADCPGVEIKLSVRLNLPIEQPDEEPADADV